MQANADSEILVLPQDPDPVWDKASATSRPCHMAVAFVSATLRLAGVRLLWPAGPTGRITGGNVNGEVSSFL